MARPIRMLVNAGLSLIKGTTGSQNPSRIFASTRTTIGIENEFNLVASRRCFRVNESNLYFQSRLPAQLSIRRLRALARTPSISVLLGTTNLQETVSAISFRSEFENLASHRKEETMNTKKLFDCLPLTLIVTGLVVALFAENVQAQQPFNSDPRSTDQREADTVRPEADRLPARSFQSPRDREETQGQTVLINSKYAGWEEASTGLGNQRISDTPRANWIMVDANGRFRGSVQPGRNANVATMNVFLMNMGRLVKQTSLDESGRFEFNNVRQGAYSLIGWGDRGFFAFGLNILAHNPELAGDIPSTVKATAFQNQTSINTDWIQHYSARVSYRVYGRYEDGEGRDDPKNQYGFDGLVKYAPSAVPATSISSHSVSKTADGRLVGRVHQMNSISGRPVDVRTTKVLLLENDSVVASTTSDNYGVFEFSGVPDGSYGVLAAGVDGVGLIGINVGSAGANTINDQGEFVNAQPGVIDFTMVSSETMGWLNHYANEVSYKRGLLAPRPQVMDSGMAYQGYGSCPHCNNCAGGCNVCQNAYENSICRSRGLTFEQWQMYCQGTGSGLGQYFGDGKFISNASRQLRKNVDKIDSLFEKAFYPDNSGALNGLNYGGCPNCGNGNCQGCGY